MDVIYIVANVTFFDPNFCQTYSLPIPDVQLTLWLPDNLLLNWSKAELIWLRLFVPDARGSFHDIRGKTRVKFRTREGKKKKKRRTFSILPKF